MYSHKLPLLSETVEFITFSSFSETQPVRKWLLYCKRRPAF